MLQWRELRTKLVPASTKVKVNSTAAVRFAVRLQAYMGFLLTEQIHRRMDSMYGGEIFERIQEVQRSMNPDAAKQKEAEDLINKKGRGICEFCEEEIFKNDSVSGSGWIWESESLVGFCDKTKLGKHKPLVKYTPGEGVHNV